MGKNRIKILKYVCIYTLPQLHKNVYIQIKPKHQTISFFPWMVEL